MNLTDTPRTSLSTVRLPGKVGLAENFTNTVCRAVAFYSAVFGRSLQVDFPLEPNPVLVQP
jgi:predicted enzyme related to lactoylglutathione lyase